MIKDILYLNSAVKKEINFAYQRLRDVVADTDANPDSHLLNKAAEMIGELSAKIYFLEMAIEQIKTDYRPTDEQQTIAVHLQGWKKQCVSAADLIGITNLRQIQTTADGINYRWTAEKPNLNFKFALDRRASLNLELCLIAFIKPRFAKKMKILIDGRHCKHSIRKQNSGFIASTTIQPSANGGLTKLTIQLPGTHSPLELGVGEGTEKKGIALSSICFQQIM